MLAVLPEVPAIELIVKLSPAVSEFTFRPVASSLKLPPDALGANPAIKLSAAGTQVGVNGPEPVWSVVETASVPKTDWLNKLRARQRTRWYVRQINM